jgi:hypothetical protein
VPRRTHCTTAVPERLPGSARFPTPPHNPMTSTTRSLVSSATVRRSGRSVRRWVALPLAAMMMTLGACSDEVTEDATAPKVEAPAAVPTAPEKALTNADDLALLLSDAQSRVLPALPESPARDSMVTAIDKLAGALISATTGPVAVALEAASKSIDRYAPALEGNTGAQADLDAIRLTMNAIATQLATDTGTGK